MSEEPNEPNEASAPAQGLLSAADEVDKLKVRGRSVLLSHGRYVEHSL